MAIIALCSASGSPGVTTTAVGLAYNWPNPVLLVEADPTGGSGVLAGPLRGEIDFPLGLAELGLAQRQRPTSWQSEMLQHTLTVPGVPGVLVMPGIRTHLQAQPMESFWAPLGQALRTLGTGRDVIIDLGRLGLLGSAAGLLEVADLVCLVTHSSLPAVAAARSYADGLKESFASGDASARVGLMIVGPKRPYPAGSLSDALGLRVFGEISWDPESAAVYSNGATMPRKFEASGYFKSLTKAGSALRSRQLALQQAWAEVVG